MFHDQREDFSFSMSKQVVQSFAIVPQEVIGNWHLETE
jgi:hypothetical protein